MEFKNRTAIASLAATLGVVIVAGLGFVALGAQQGPPQGPSQGWGPGGRGPGMFGRGPGGPMGGMIMRGLRQLNLTDDQKTQIKGVLDSNKAADQAIAKRMFAARQALRDAVVADPNPDPTVNEAAIRAAAVAVGAVEADAAVQWAKVRAQVFALLTPEQQAKAKQLQADAKGRFGRGGRGGRGGPGGPGGIGGWI